MTSKLEKHILATYQYLRIGLAVTGIIFPVLLALGGRFHGLTLEGSMSAYYHASPQSQADERVSRAKFDMEHPNPTQGQLEEWMDKAHTHPHEGTMRDWFVGLLFVVGVMLFLYRGFTSAENNALNLAGLCAVGVALFPTSWRASFEGRELDFLGFTFSVHGACAVLLFLCIAYVAIFRSKDTLDLLTDKKQRERYRRLYVILGWAMVASPVAAFIMVNLFEYKKALVFAVEFFGIWVFSAYWGVKSRELARTQAERKAVKETLARET
ncbi:hypothetical protein [Roseimicrobium gellanilyticum]|nr:hypothetical protein [Roseimicrobium gellanilyticum]